MKKLLIWIQSAVNTTFGKAAVTMADAIIDSKLEALLQDLHDSNIDDYKATIAAGNAFFKHLIPLVAKTENTLDDAIVSDWTAVIQKSAVHNGIAL